MAESIKIEIFRKKLPDELTKALSDADSRSDIGSGAAMTAATACAWFLRAAALTAGAKGGGERLDYMLRNGEILRGYMIHLIDEDVKCRGPLRKARKEGDERTIEAAMQPAAAIANEIVNMMHQLLELLDELADTCADDGKRFIAASADLAMGAIHACRRYVLELASHSSDDTYQYIVRRENEITLEACAARYDSILAKTGY